MNGGPSNLADIRDLHQMLYGGAGEVDSVNIPTLVHVVILKDRAGRPRGFEKTSGRFHLILEDAHAELSAMGDVGKSFGVFSCVIALDRTRPS